MEGHMRLPNEFLALGHTCMLQDVYLFDFPACRFPCCLLSGSLASFYDHSGMSVFGVYKKVGFYYTPKAFFFCWFLVYAKTYGFCTIKYTPNLGGVLTTNVFL